MNFEKGRHPVAEIRGHALNLQADRHIEQHPREVQSARMEKVPDRKSVV